MSNNENVFVVQCFNNIEPYFDKPINSIKLHIAIVYNLADELICISVNDTNFKKYMILNNAQNLKIAYPILHSSKQI